MRISGQSIAASLAPERLEDGMDPIVFQGLTPNSPEGDFGYNIPNVLIDHAMRNPHILAGFWRGVNVNHNAIYIECFIDELAHELKQDPLAFRLKMLKPKHAAVLKAVAEKAGWGTPAPAGVFRGLAAVHGLRQLRAPPAPKCRSSADGVLKIHRIVAATDPGTAVNPAQIERQVAGSFVYGLSALHLRRVHGEGRRDRADELRHLQRHAHPRDAEGRNDRDAVRRLLGRRRRADHRGGGAGRAQRDLRGDRQAPAHDARSSTTASARHRPSKQAAA